MVQPVIILIRPQLVENIGTVARAMLNCCLTELRIVNPRDAWPLASPQKERMEAASSGADIILKNAKIYENTADSVKDLHGVYATTARETRDIIKAGLTPRDAIEESFSRLQAGHKIGLMFGPERTGLTNEDLQVAEKMIHIPANPEFSSFNLAQAVLIVAYEWMVKNAAPRREEISYGKTRPATKEELLCYFDHLERELGAKGFFSTPEMRPSMVQNIRNAVLRAELTEQEVRTWHGIIAALVKR